MSFNLVLGLVCLYSFAVGLFCVVKYRSQGSLTIAASLLAASTAVGLFVLALVAIA